MADFVQTPSPRLRVSMIVVGVTDMDRSVKFYLETLGLEPAGEPGEVTLFHAGGVMLALNRPLGRAAGGFIAGAVEIVLPVESVTAARKEFGRRGCPFVREPREVFPGAWAASFTDPDGHLLTFLGPR
jgi:uncharacterized protein